MDFDALYLRALKFLNFRPRSEKEVRDYLHKKLKNFSTPRSHRKQLSHSEVILESQEENKVRNNEGFIELIIHKLHQQRFLNDQEFARWLVRSRTEFKPKGKYLIQQELRQKGIAQDIINEIVSSERVISEDDLAAEVLLSKKRKYEHMENNERFTKAGSMLARRGFSLDTIKTAIDRVFGKMV